MKLHDANRRRPTPTADITKDTLTSRPLSLGSPRLGQSINAPPVPPLPPIRNMMQSASVCDLTSPQLWNTGMHQVNKFIAFKY